MKHWIIFFCCLATLQQTSAQIFTQLKLPDQFPAAGEKMMVAYDPSGAVLEEQSAIMVKAFYYDSLRKTGEEKVMLQKNGKFWTGQVNTPVNTALIHLVFVSPDGQLKDNNNGDGYLLPVYKNKKPVQYAFYRMSVLSEGIPLDEDRLKKNLVREIFLMKEEVSNYPTSETRLMHPFYNLLANSPEREDKELLVKKLLALKTDKEADLIMAHLYLYYFGKKQQADSLEKLMMQKFPDGEYVKSKKIKDAHPEGASTQTVTSKSEGEIKKTDTATTPVHKSYDKYFYQALRKTMLDEPVAPIVLMDINGNKVSIGEGDLKGKVIVIDFWATWCKPCIKSFPAMHKVMEKYSTNPDVKFFFICTLEPEDAATKAKEFVKKNPYPFTFLIDEKTDDISLYKAYAHYKVAGGIPYKLVLDKNGNVRFRAGGFAGDDDALINELSAMIELAGEPH